MAPSRRVLLRSTGLVLAGLGRCAAGYEPPPRPEPEECPDSPRMPDADPHPDGADLPPVPNPPDSLDAGPVTQYASDYELAWAWREATHLFDSPLVEVLVDGTFEARREGRNAVLAWSLVVPGGRVQFNVDTDSPSYFDKARYVVAYLVTDAGAWRAAKPRPVGADSPSLDPHREGRLIHCF